MWLQLATESMTLALQYAFHPSRGDRPMAREDAIRHHVDRAFEELDRARAAATPEAAIAHLGLSELHLGRMKALSDETDSRPVLKVVGGA